MISKSGVGFNKEKFKQVFHYIIHKCGSLENVGKTVLYKLLYFSDFDYYELYEKPLTGEIYRKIAYGPAPSHINKVINELKKKEKIKYVRTKYKQYPQQKFISTKEPEMNLLNGTEMQLINKVIKKLSGMTARQISEYSHKDMPWKTAKMGGILDYGMVFYRDALYSVIEKNDV